jgi:hypothetical protein
MALAAVVAAVLLAGPAASDDEIEIDQRLVDAGFEDAVTSYHNADGGVRVLVDYRTGSADRVEYEAEAAEIGRLVWESLDLRVQTVDVAPTSAVGWLDGDVPPAISFARGDLQQRFGARRPALDANDSSFWGSDEGGLLFAGVAALVILLVGAGGGFLAGFLLGRRRRPDAGWGAPPVGTWGGPAGQWGGPAGQSAGPPAPPSQPGPWGGPGPTGQGGAPPSTGADPWRPV